ncbi:NYN domain-containing protein [Duganella sp. FT134W]|uniref:NYN domain-containing protein n=1 Tax=Duganella margarita TaxID=2692170 RepID=A0A7X4KGG6_9BURK|nr:NYN domain-containing protein [Duganella margarita]MYM72564.1 NYN domain-containing protein [Duganella margarita]
MASSNENVSMALFCDFENVALGVRDANYDKFDIKPVLERLLLKGSIVVKKAYCDWDRYKGFKAPMHEANFELIEIPHVRQSGKNSADIRMVVDALDLCYTKSHVDTFVIISGDSDFSPLVSKLRENAKKVIGVGVKQSTSDLLVANCDEFIFYDDLVRESRRAKRESSGATDSKPQVKRTPEEERARREEMDKRRNQAVEIAVNTFEALVLERGDSGKIWASVLKEAIKRRKPDFSESYYGFRTFGNLIEECKARGYLEFGRDEKSGAYVYRANGGSQPSVESVASEEGTTPAAAPVNDGGQESRRSRNRGRTAAERFAERQAQRQTQQPRHNNPQSPADGETIVIAAPEVAEQADIAPVVLEAAVELPAAETAVPKKRNGAKLPARKVKNAAKKGQGDADGDSVVEAAREAAPAPEAAPAAPEPAPAPVDAEPSQRPAGQRNQGRQNQRKPNQGKQNAARPKAAASVAISEAPVSAPVAAPAPTPAPAPAEAAGEAAKPAKAKPKAKPAAKPATARKPAAPRAPRPPKAAPASEE